MRTDVEVASALDAVCRFLRRYVVFSLQEQSTVVALWVAHTYCLAAFDTTCYLIISSAEKRSGKSLLLDLLELLVLNPWRVALPSESVLFRKMADVPTVLFDEIDAVFGPKASNYEGLRALLNSGYRRGTKVPRCVGEGSKMRVEDFEVFSAKALAGIGQPPDTVADRGVGINLRRRNRSEPIERFRYRDAEFQAVDLRDALAAWAETSVEQLKDARPDIPEALNDRTADVVEPLLAIADAAGGEWPERARSAIVALAGELSEDDSLPVRLLADIRKVFEVREAERIWTQDLISELVKFEESPWGDYYGRDIGPHGIAKHLKRYEIKPGLVRIGEDVKRGYLREQFEDAWSRYLLPSPSSERGIKRYSVTAPPSDSPSRNGVTEKPLSQKEEDESAEPETDLLTRFNLDNDPRPCLVCKDPTTAVRLADGAVVHPACESKLAAL
jgi:hypothetical protein